ncbi:lysophospholipid acyltransferase family protein [Candidatus Dependentiae bacterium]|nr:lysophospholipid acyltransferase family protein [Candidatus Dependentiae bacterium]
MVFATLRLILILFFRSIGRALFYFFKKRRQVALKNVTRCYSFIFKNKSYSRGKTRRLVKQSFAGLGHNLADFLLLGWYTRDNINRYVSAHSLHHLKQAQAKGRGVIISTAHFGCWELAAHYLALKGFKSLIIYNKFKGADQLDGCIKQQRERSGNRLIAKKNSYLSLYKHLKRNGSVMLVTDQHAFPPEGAKVSFLGQDAWTHTAFIKMSIKTGAPIVPAYMFVQGYTKYLIEFSRPIDPDDFVSCRDPIYEMTRACNEALERSIVESPELWMWQHQRFKQVSNSR